MCAGVCYNNVLNDYQFSKIIALNIIIFDLPASIVMANLFKIQKQPKIDNLVDQEEIEVPLKKQVPSQRIICQIHSTGQKKEEIKYINIGFIAKNKPQFCRTFLCDVCYREFKRKNPSNEDLKKIQSVKRFQYKYIESVFEKYPEENFNELMNSLQKAETQMCSDIDSLNQALNQYCEIYKKNIKEFFQTLRKPIDKTQLEKFVRGRMNEGMIEEFYHNYKKVNKYDVLIGNKNKEVLEGVYHGFNASMDKISKDVKGLMNRSFEVVKQYIEKYDDNNLEAEKSEKMVPESEQKRQTILNVDQRRPKPNSKAETPSNNLNSFFEQRKTSSQHVQQKKEVKHKKEAEGEENKKKRRRDSSSDSSDESSDSDSSSSNSERRIIKDQNGQKIRDSHKHKAIQKQNRDKPYRNQNVIMIDQEFIKDSRNRTALYVVLKANTVRSGAQRVFRMDVEDFKRRYPLAFNKYVNLRDARK